MKTQKNGCQFVKMLAAGRIREDEGKKIGFASRSLVDVEQLVLTLSPAVAQQRGGVLLAALMSDLVGVI